VRGYTAAVAGYSFPEIHPVEARLKRCVHLASVLVTADLPALRAELHARLAEGDPAIAQALAGARRGPLAGDPTP
jgi:hypothetical protein